MQQPDAAIYQATRFTYDPRRAILWAELCRYLQPKYISPQDVLLEIGSGYCHFINHIQARIKYAFDISPTLASYAAADVTPYIQSCASLAPVESNSVDVVLASNVFEHLRRNTLNATLREIHRVLQPGGTLIILQPNFQYSFRRYFDDYTHRQIFTHSGMADLLASHSLIPTLVKPKFLPLSLKSRLPVWPLLIRLYLRSPYKPFAGQMLIIAGKAP